MSQTRESGAAANRWGAETARKIADKIGAEMRSRNSNECDYNDKRAVLKCAKEATTSVGVTYKMLERLDTVIAAFQSADGKFHLWEMSPEEYKRNMRPTASRGDSRGKVGIVERDTFERKGRHIGTITLDLE